jgi:O-antigen/teichoic acid export membrane protein
MLLNAAVARSLGASDFGTLYLVTSVATFAYIFVDWGHGPYVIRQVALSQPRTGELLGTVIAVRGLTAVGLALPAVVVGNLLGYDGRTQLGIAVMMLAWVPIYLGLSFTWAFRGIERMEFDALINVLLKLLSLVLGILVLLSGGRALAVIGAGGIAGAVTLVTAIQIYRKLGLSKLRVTPAVARELMIGGAPLMTMTIAIGVQQYIDAILLSKLAPAQVLGWYGAALTFSGTLVGPAVVLGNAAYPRFSVTAANEREFGIVLREALRPVLFVAALGVVGICLFADFAVSVVYSADKFGPSATILRSFTPAMVLVFLDMILATAIQARGRVISLASAKIVSVIVIAGAELLLIPVCQAQFGNGGVGVMLAFAIGELVMVAAAVSLLRSAGVNRRMAADVLRAFAAATGTWLAFRYLGAGLWPLVAIPLCVSLFTLLALLLGLVSSADLMIMARFLPGSRRVSRTLLATLSKPKHNEVRELSEHF